MFKGLFFLLLVFLIRASFSKNDEKHVSKKININCIKLWFNVFSGYCSLAYAGASRSFVFIQWGHS